MGKYSTHCCYILSTDVHIRDAIEYRILLHGYRYTIANLRTATGYGLYYKQDDSNGRNVYVERVTLVLQVPST